MLALLFQSVTDNLIQLFTTPLFSVGQTKFTLWLLTQLLVSIVTVFFVIGLFKRFLKRQLLVKMGVDPSNREAIATLCSYLLGAIAILIIIQNSGIDLSSLGIILGGLGVGIGFGLQHIANDFISGLLLLFERNLKVNDLIELDEYRFNGLVGRIIEVKLRSTIIRTLDDGEVVIPNGQLVQNRVMNWTYDTPIARLKIPVRVAYDNEAILVSELLLKSAYMEPAVYTQPMPKAMFLEFIEDGVVFELWVWIDYNHRFDILSSLHFIIEHNFKQHDIEFAFPQRDVWIRNPESFKVHLNTPSSTAKPELPSQNQPFHHPKGPQDIPLPYRRMVQGTLKPQPTLRDMLRKVTYFENFSDLEIRQLIEIGYRQRYKTGIVLFQEGDPGDAFYVILEGSIDIIADKLDRTLATLLAGQSFGEVALLLGIPRTAGARVNEDALLFVISYANFSNLLRRYPELSDVLMQEMGKHREELAKRQAEMRALNLVDATEDDVNPVLWARKRLRRLFTLN
jgi:potassium-dependent mechanosensitive channel